MSDLKYKVGDKVRIKSLDWYNENKNPDYGFAYLGNGICFYSHMSIYCGKTMTISEILGCCYRMVECVHDDWTDEMIEGLVEEETPKFKVNDIVFVRNIGLVSITNSYWDSLANEYIYEAMGLNGESEYDSINQSNIGYLMLSESMIPHTGGDKITIEEYKNNDKEWLFNKLAMLDNIAALESIQDIFNHLQLYKYPKTYEECAEIITELTGSDCNPKGCMGYMSVQLTALQKLFICRDAYWKIAGDEMELGKPWEPDYNNEKQLKYGLYEILKYSLINPSQFAFPTEEMRDAFYENFKEDIEKCKKLF